MSVGGFAVLCSAGGLVTKIFEGNALRLGMPLVLAVAPDSRERLLQILTDARQTEQHTVLHLAEDVSVEIHSASDGAQWLVVAGTHPSDVRRRCEALREDPEVGPLAQRIAETSVPDELTLDLWSELARVNNDLATTQRQLAKKNAELRWLNEQKNLLLGMAAHDLRNPLAAVIGYAAFVMEDRALLPPNHAAMIERIQVNARTMLGIVEDVLDFSAIESGTVRLQVTEFTPADLLAEVGEINSLIADRKNIRIAQQVDPKLPSLRADRRKLTQVLNNLVTNAIKFSHPGSTVELVASPGEGGGVCLAVTDHGLGMSRDQIAKLFEPFARIGVLPTGGEGSTGLGLAIVRRIVEAHRGRVDVTSAPEQGTTFAVVLPRSCLAS